ncbi:AHH domain-containing protein [uncultured Photobacterium sp.]|uniref:AHH domain-containing protein n=1 Tax=uncultured Photobacterium sp. TaxID=173973 RepID=UPI00262B8A0C|nr:AHH domain-containing protein [uncultured Photobacterium sp.]
MKGTKKKEIKERKLIEAKGTVLASNIASESHRGSLSNHPWYDRDVAGTAGGLEAHHIITNKNLNSPNWRGWRKAYDYDINEHQNGVMFPSNPQIACQVETQVHRSNHNRGLIYTSLKEKYIDKGEPIPDSECEKIYKNGLRYLKGVDDEIQEVFDNAKIKYYCKAGKKDEFTEDLRGAAEDILDCLADFTWTISRYGKDYKRGILIGCSNGLDESKNKKRTPCSHRTKEIDTNTNQRVLIHEYKNGNGIIMKPRKLEVGK